MTTSRRRLGAFWRGALGSLMNGERPLETLHRALSLQFSTSRQIQLILHYVPNNAGEPITPYRSVVLEMRGRLVSPIAWVACPRSDLALCDGGNETAWPSCDNLVGSNWRWRGVHAHHSSLVTGT